MMRTTLLAALVSAAIPVTALAQSADELKNDDKTPGDVLTYGMGYSQHRFSPLTQINRQTVKRLVPAWSYSLADNRGLEGQALVKDGVVFLTDHEKTVAVDALTGREIWKTMVEYPPETTRVVCCGIVNRGAALFDGKLYRTTLDANVIALDAKTGKEVWRTKSSDPKDGYSMTVAPLVANGVVIAGVAGAEYGIRGYLEGFDAQTGKSLWRTYTIPDKGEPGSETWPGDTWKQGGGSTWITGSYDPELDLVYWGTGNPAPWNPLNRKGDNLYTNSVLAIQPKTGKVVWHFQMTPGDPFDYDGVNEWILAELPVNGGTRKVIMQANRNGYLYVIERATGKLVAANAFVKVNWADGINKETGRPVWSAETKAVVEKGQKQRIYPAVSGGKNWGPMSFDPTKRLLYINTNDWGMDYKPAPVEQVANLKAGQPHYGEISRGIRRRQARPPAGDRSAHGQGQVGAAVQEPEHRRYICDRRWPRVHGHVDRRVHRRRCRHRKDRLAIPCAVGIVGQPITWEKDGKQYLTVTSGIGGVYALKMGDPNVAKVPAGGSLWTFKLFED